MRTTTPGRFTAAALFAAATLAALTAATTPAPAMTEAPAAPAAARKACANVGGEKSGARAVTATFHNRSVTVKATVSDHQTGSTRLHVKAIQGSNVTDYQTSVWVNDDDRKVSMNLAADSPGGASAIEYWTESTYGTSGHRICTR
ncbi:hypothetical protein OG787_27800 [Streptomyces sp. NBC_00075]|uniref:hypothetical protein n=1 Tax=Streptomyces sp. NBC_00075 TaxID=2975641 RepID=UPI0032521937